MNKTIPAIGLESQALIALINKLAVGEVLTYAQIEQATGRPLNEVRFAINTARQRCLLDFGIATAVIRLVGIKRLSDAENVEAGGHGFIRIRRIAKRSAAQLRHGTKDFDALSDNERKRHNALLGTYGVVAHVATERRIARIEEKIGNGNYTPPPRKILEFFK